MLGVKSRDIANLRWAVVGGADKLATLDVVSPDMISVWLGCVAGRDVWRPMTADDAVEKILGAW